MKVVRVVVSSSRSRGKIEDESLKKKKKKLCCGINPLQRWKNPSKWNICEGLYFAVKKKHHHKSLLQEPTAAKCKSCERYNNICLQKICSKCVLKKNCFYIFFKRLQTLPYFIIVYIFMISEKINKFWKSLITIRWDF